jgi:hypothetical protein
LIDGSSHTAVQVVINEGLDLHCPDQEEKEFPKYKKLLDAALVKEGRPSVEHLLGKPAVRKAQQQLEYAVALKRDLANEHGFFGGLSGTVVDAVSKKALKDAKALGIDAKKVAAKISG